MYFSLTELEHHPIHFDVCYPPGEIPLPGEYRQQGELRAIGTAELLRNTLGEIRIRGHVNTRVDAACDRCLDPASQAIDAGLDLFYRPVLKTSNHAEMHLEEGEIDIAFYEGDGLALEDALREFVLLSLPMQMLCRQDCKGLCPICGGNRNLRECGCQRTMPDPRWEALRNL